MVEGGKGKARTAYDIPDESAVPIDIPVQGIVQWMVEREVIQEDQAARLKEVRARLDDCLAKTPDVPEVIELLGASGSYIDYSTCAKVLDALKADATTVRLRGTHGKKSWFGSLTDKHALAWQAVMDGYSAHHIYLGEWAQQLQHMQKYEIPNMKKKVGRMKAGLPELRRKAGECKAMSKQHHAAFEAECERLGIKGDSVEAELRELSSQLPAVFAEVGELLVAADVVQARELYVDLVAYVHKLSAETARAMLPTLRRAQASGVRTGTGGADGSAQAAEPVAEIDWGIEDEPAATGGTLETAEADIDWGIDVVQEPSADIDWGIDQDSAGTEGSAESDAINVGFEICAEGGAGGEEGAVDLSSPPQRALLVNDLLELEAFLSVRVEEMGKSEAINLLASMDFPLARLDRDQVAKLHTSVSTALEKLNGERAHQLIMLNSSDRFIKRLAQATVAPRKSAEQMMKRSAELEGQMEAHLERERVEIPKFEQLKAKAQVLKREIEQTLSNMYGRPVFVQGNFE